ncbi:hypothetical protein VP01_2520g2 [Puccinia sorghi]|uniref:Pre-mRNA-splicing factor PRP46 n=1 Tax=Puccinia sorghi TaxID=27349 RepID=A0A0L6V5I2_9BASI|nr:hypothetical protein VP01_2520g2 [Puccinia sorghi]
MGRTSTTTHELSAVDRSLKRTHALFSSSKPLDCNDVERNIRMRLVTKTYDEYRDCITLPSAVLDQQAGQSGPSKPPHQQGHKSITAGAQTPLRIQAGPSDSSELALTGPTQHAAHQQSTLLSKSLIRRREARSVKPDFHPQSKLHRGISGHLGWVWDLASGNLKLSLTGHISTVRGLAVSDRHPYLFSCGEDKMVKCWDLEQNKVIRHYHGHLSGVYSLSLHPTLDVLVTAGRNASARVRVMRTKGQVHVLSGHTATIADVKCQESDPQVITGSMDSTIRLWDLAAGRTMAQLTHHHKSVRSLTIHPTEYSFASGSAGGNNIKKWKCPEGMFVHNFSGHDAIINTICVNEEGVMYSGADNGSMTWWDYKTGLPFQTMSDIPQPGSLDAEAGVFCSTFDATGSRLITGHTDIQAQFQSLLLSTSSNINNQLAIDNEHLDQLAAIIRNIHLSKQQDAFLKHLNQFIIQKEAEIEGVSRDHYQDFLASVDKLLSVRQRTISLKSNVVSLDRSLQSAGTGLATVRSSLLDARKVSSNIQETVETLQSCLKVLHLSKKLSQQISERKFYSALRSLDELQFVHLKPLLGFAAFAGYLGEALPNEKIRIREEVTKQLNSWLYDARQLSQQLGRLALEALELRDRRWEARKDRVNPQDTASIALLVNLNTPVESAIVGFFIIETQTVGTTKTFRDENDVDSLWQELSDRIVRIVRLGLMDCSDIGLLLGVKTKLLLFSQTLESYDYSVSPFHDLLGSFATQFTEMLFKKFSQEFVQFILEDDHQPMQVHNEDEFSKVVEKPAQVCKSGK